MIRASIRYGNTYGWTDVFRPDDGTLFRSVSEVLRELKSPGSVTDRPAWFFPCAGQWNADERVVAFIYPTYDNGEAMADPVRFVRVGPRGGLHVESC